MSIEFRDLVIVPGHASFKEAVPLPLPEDIQSDQHWVLQSFQHNEPPFYIEHIHRSLELIDSHTLLVFSGGRTHKESGKFWSEAKTYDEIAKLSPSYPLAHVALEESARDSFQNLDFSIHLFEKVAKHRPLYTCIVGWAFKEKRFKLHAKTLGLTEDEFRYIGVNNPTADNLTKALQGEQKTIAEFMDCPRGDSGVLLAKRNERNPFDEVNPWQ